MEQVIKEYLNINAPKYAEFKGYNEDFIKAVNDFTEGAKPTEQVLQFYDEAMDTVKKFLEGGNIPKFQLGGVPNWYDILYPQKELINWTPELDASLAGDNLTKNKLHHQYKDLTGAYNANQAYTSRHDLVGQDLNTFYNSDYSGKSLEEYVKGYNENNASAIRSRWDRTDIKYKDEDARKHNRLFRRMFANRSGNTENPYDLGYSESTEPIQGSTTWMRRMDRYEKKWLDLTDEEKKNRIHKIGDLGYVYKENNGDIGIVDDDTLKRLGLNIPAKPVSPDIQTKSDLESGIPNVAHKPFTFGGRISEMFPHLFELGKYFNTIRTNKKIRDLGLQHIPVTSEFIPKHLNIYGDLAALNQSYNEAANLQQKANRLGANTSDYRTGVAINLQGLQQAEQGKAQARKISNDLVRTTSDRATQLEFDNIDKEQENANKNYANTVDNWNYRNDVRMAYENLKHQNYKNFLDYLETEFKQKDLNRKQFYASMLDSQRVQAIDNNPEVLRAMEAYKTATNETDKTKAYNNWVDARNRVIKQITPLYYQELAKIKGIKYNPNNNPFMVYAKSGVKISDDGPVRTRSKDLERRRKSRKDARDSNDKKLDRLGRLMYLHAKGASSRK